MTVESNFRSAPPPSLKGVDFQVPVANDFILSNGLRLTIFEDKRLPLVSFRLAFTAGDAQDPDGRKGVTSAMASLLVQGTESRNSKQIAEEVETLGASLGASSSVDNIVIAASALSAHTDSILDLMSDIVLRPAFPEQELNLYKQNALKNLEYQRSQPDFLAEEQLAKLIYGEHPYSAISPDKSDIEALSRQAIVEIWQDRFMAGSGLMLIVGDVSSSEMVEKLEERFGQLPSGNVPAFSGTALPPRSLRSLTIVDRPGSTQSNIVIGNYAVPRTHPDYYKIIVMNQILGAGASSRLFMNLREEKGYTYGAYSSFDMRRQAGVFESSAEVRTDVTSEALKEFFFELERIGTEPVTDDELFDAKSFLTGVFPLRAETQEGITNLLLTQKLYALPDDYLQTYRDKVSSVTKEDVLETAKKYVRPTEAAVVIVGDAAEVLKQARPFAETVEVYDTEGKVQPLENYAGGDVADIDPIGEWDLLIKAQGQEVGVSMTFTQVGEEIGGEINSPFGSASLTQVRVEGNSLKGTAVLDFQGQEMGIALSGRFADKDSISGALVFDGNGLPPLEFSGKRA